MKQRTKQQNGLTKVLITEVLWYNRKYNSILHGLDRLSIGDSRLWKHAEKDNSIS